MQEKLKKIYELYNKKEYRQAKTLVDEILLSDPSNIYAKRYISLLNPFLKETHSKVKDGTIAKIKGKKLTCPHCSSAIALSALNTEQKQKIRENNYQNLSLKCPYCHTTFTLQKNTLNSVLGIKIGDTINYNKKTYRAVGAVKYDGIWKEGGYSGGLNYLEWILLGNDNSYLYFSEGYFLDDGLRNYEYEFSEKITPNFNFSVHYDAGYIEINNTKVKFSEKNNVETKKLHGENSKVFEVGEKVELFEFSYAGAKYVLEKERAGRQAEAGIYKTKSVSQKVAANYFGKEIKQVYGKSKNFDLGSVVGWIFMGIVLIIALSDYLNGWIIFGIVLVGIAGFASYKILSGNYSPKIKKIVISMIIGPAFAVSIAYPIGNWILDNKKEIPLEKITDGQRFEVKFTNPNLQSEKKVRSTRYDYGGIKTHYESKGGLKFSVKTEEDKKIIEKLKTFDEKTKRVYEIFQEKIYTLR